ncbi:MAG: hypothetical protein AAF235_10990 [Planctomycetota bacterium]
MYSAITDRVRQDGVEPLLCVESCGEKHGLASPDRLEEWAAYIETTGHEFASLAEALAVSVVNPYPVMLEAWPGLPTHEPTDHRWNVTGHRIAAQCLHGALRERGLIRNGER